MIEFTCRSPKPLVCPLSFKAPNDVYYEIVSHLTLKQFKVLASLNREWYGFYQKFRHVSLQCEFYGQLAATSNRLSPVIKDHPCKVELVQDLKTCKSFRSTKAWISRWMGKLFVLSKRTNWLEVEGQTERNLESSEQVIKFFSQVASRNRSDINHISHVFYHAVKPCNYYDNLCLSNPSLDSHPLMRGIIYWHARYSFNSSVNSTNEKDLCFRIGEFVKSHPVLDYIKRGDLRIEDVKLPLARLELERWIQPVFNRDATVGYFNSLTNEEKDLVITTSIIQELKLPSDHLETKITLFESLDGVRVSNLRRKVYATDYFKIIKERPLIVTIIGLAILALGCYYFDSLLSDKVRDEGLAHKYIPLTVLTLTAGLTITIAGLILQCIYIDHNDQKALFLKK